MGRQPSWPLQKFDDAAIHLGRLDDEQVVAAAFDERRLDLRSRGGQPLERGVRVEDDLLLAHHEQRWGSDAAELLVRKRDRGHDPTPGNSSTGGASAGPLIRTKVGPYDVSTVRASDGTGQRSARAS